MSAGTYLTTTPVPEPDFLDLNTDCFLQFCDLRETNLASQYPSFSNCKWVFNICLEYQAIYVKYSE